MRKLFLFVFFIAMFYFMGSYAVKNEIIELPSFLQNIVDNQEFNIISTNDNKDISTYLINYGKENGFSVKFSFYDDLEIIEELKNKNNYDAVWLNNSIWFNSLDDVNLTGSESISINPVVFAIKKSKAESLGFINKKISNKEIVNAIKTKKFKYIMGSVSNSSTGLIAYLGFINSLSSSTRAVTLDDLKDEVLINHLTNLFSGVERVSGSDTFLEDIFLNEDKYEAVIANESSLISINQKLINEKKEPLYLIYPSDGVALNDSPFAYINRNQNKYDKFELLKSYLLNPVIQTKLASSGRRTWYGGTNSDVDKEVFNPEWGINTSEYLMSIKLPKEEVISEAINIYIDKLKKPTSVVFCLDYSGSMLGDNIAELRNAMEGILSYDLAQKEKIQFSSKDKIVVSPFNSSIIKSIVTENGKETTNMIKEINRIEPEGGTNMYDCLVEALRILKYDKEEYNKSVVLMSDGESNTGTFLELETFYNNNELNIPIYSIMFGEATESSLNEISKLTNGKIFDGKTSLKNAFKEVRKYN